MGYSSTAAASRTSDLWVKACVAQTGSSNTFKANRAAYFFERGRENDDGAETGTVYKTVLFNGEPGFARRIGTYRINPDGTVARAPAFLKKASAERDRYLRETPGAREHALATGG